MQHVSRAKDPSLSASGASVARGAVSSSASARGWGTRAGQLHIPLEAAEESHMFYLMLLL